MAIQNGHRFTAHVIKWDLMNDSFGGKYRVLAKKPYSDAKGRYPDGWTLTLQIGQDTFDYGTDKSGNKIYDNTGQTFDATVFNRAAGETIDRGDMVELEGFREDASFYIDYSFILRFDTLKKVAVQAKPTAKAGV